MKRPPFNACDYLCERCGETESCEIYALLLGKALSRQPCGTSRELPVASLQDVKESLDETMEMLKKIAEGLDIELDDAAGGGGIDRCSVDDDDLYKLALTFTRKTYTFLKAVEPFIKQGGKGAFEDLVWYHRMVSVKTRRAVASDYGGFPEDALDSAGVATKSLTQCVEAFGRIRRSCFFAAAESRRLSETALEIKRQLRKRFSRGVRQEDARE